MIILNSDVGALNISKRFTNYDKNNQKVPYQINRENVSLELSGQV